MEAIGAVADTGPLIAFAKLDKLSLLTVVFDVIWISPGVQYELAVKRGTESRRLQAAIGTFIRIATYPKFSPEVKSVTASLDIGEAESVALAFDSGFPLIIDERLGRSVATRLKVPIVGSIGIILEAKRRGYLSHVAPLFVELRQAGYWLSDDLVAHALTIADESPQK